MMTDEQKKDATPAPGPAPAPAPAESELDKARREAAANLDLAKRSQAELVNAQARMARELESGRRFALESFAREMLPFLDGLDKAAQNGDGPAVEAMRLLSKEMVRVLAKFGIQPIETKGKKFDPVFHEAVAVVESAELPEQSVVAEVRRGWMLNDRVLRPADVTVARKAQG